MLCGFEVAPKKPDLAVICSSAVQVPEIVEQCGEAGILGVIIITAGFKETGAEGKALEEKLNLSGRSLKGCGFSDRTVWNYRTRYKSQCELCYGIPRMKYSIYLSIRSTLFLCSGLGNRRKVGFSHFVSIGNTLDVDFGDLIDYFGEDEKTKSIILYIESLSQARKFMSAARAFARTKPIIAYKAGRFPESAEAAASHTGAMASEDSVFDAAFRRVGMVRVMNIGEIFDCADLLGRKKIPLGRG